MKTLDDFSYEMRNYDNHFNTAVESLKAQIRLLWAQGIITENAMQVLHQPITDFCIAFKQTESGFYEIRNILAEKDK